MGNEHYYMQEDHGVDCYEAWPDRTLDERAFAIGSFKRDFNEQAIVGEYALTKEQYERMQT